MAKTKKVSEDEKIQRELRFLLDRGTEWLQIVQERGMPLAVMAELYVSYIDLFCPTLRSKCSAFARSKVSMEEVRGEIERLARDKPKKRRKSRAR